MTDLGLWFQSKSGEAFLIKKDENGYPDLISLQAEKPLEGVKAKKEKGKSLYEELTGKKYPHENATSRQVLWDFLEIAIQKLP